ncbi:unannotated protein [freshwater metagenome]|uniref:Unannotated protein n=1 Tax=freshwater metagenome TaxID=449393 RepID=A0A6J6KEI3_9ZZZZ
MKSREPAPGLRSWSVGSEEQLRLEFFRGDIPFALLGQDSVNLIAHLREVFNIQRRIDEPRGWEWPGGPVSSRVFFRKTQAQYIFHNTLETNSGKPGEPGSQFRIKKGDGVHPGFAKTGKVLVGRVNNPFEMGELMRNVIECPHTHRVNQEVRCPRSVGLH